MPFLKLMSKKDTKLGSYDAIEISGMDLGKNEEWTKKFFKGKQTEHLMNAINDVDVGDEINVVMEQDPKNAKWWNIKSISLMTEEDRKSLEKKQSFSKGGGEKSTTKSSNFPRRVDGGSRGDDTNRSAAIYLAKEIYAASAMEEASGCEDISRKLIEIAEHFIYPYIKDGTLPPPKEEKVRGKKELPVPKV